MRLQDKLHGLKQEFEANAPKEALEIMHQATRDLVASDLLDHIPSVGRPAPAFELTDASGNPVDSRKLQAKGPLVVTFYRGAW
ncbi:redoxin domain-containing protein [Desulfoluna spongiiphila]|uniref:AhpC/TSA family protein n=1 Tax=Desulfoluna spongiiphila TaxID=419481 RepID=A0A1G5ADX0_9BACT|nr:redoxin domain-containing protein [Desulfoluna spongiiphila]SCX76090.1 AhpC/TSA family protein [Desulfoluna spongiiphila]VVS90681.1 alkyl hydroperoxide reductase subunit c/ thiol specific antioxidant [Desulfoluna spongiiphila]